jgi:hypothetical protein
VIPAAEPEVLISTTRTASEWAGGQFYADGDAAALGVSAHGHLLMKKFRITADAGLPTERILLDIPDWNFHWQGQWLFQAPLSVLPTTQVTVDCTYDNSDAHRRAVGA